MACAGRVLACAGHVPVWRMPGVCQACAGVWQRVSGVCQGGETMAAHSFCRYSSPDPQFAPKLSLVRYYAPCNASSPAMSKQMHPVHERGCPVSGSVWNWERVLAHCDGNCMESVIIGVPLSVLSALLPVSALLHPREVHLGSSCLPLHCNG